MNPATVVLAGGIIGLLILLLRLSRFQMEVMQTFEAINRIHRQFKIDTMDILYSFREVNKDLAAILERETEIIDMINQMESQEADIEKAFQAVFAGRGESGGAGRRGSDGPPPKPREKSE